MSNILETPSNEDVLSETSQGRVDHDSRISTDISQREGGTRLRVGKTLSTLGTILLTLSGLTGGQADKQGHNCGGACPACAPKPLVFRVKDDEEESEEDDENSPKKRKI